MKKILGMFIVLCTMMTTITVFAADDNIDTLIKEIWLDPTVNSGVIDNIKEKTIKKCSRILIYIQLLRKHTDRK